MTCQLAGPTAWQRLYLVAVAVAAGALCWAETATHGIGISPDSVDYLLQARRLAGPGGLGALLTPDLPASQPPLYPLLLALIERVTGVDPAIASRPLNAGLLAALIYACGAGLLARPGRPVHPWVFVAAPLGLLLSRSLHDVSGMAWSEPLFLVLCVSFLIALSQYLRRGSRPALVGAALFAVAAMYTRYSGVTLVAAGVLAVPFAARRSARQKLSDGVGFAIATTLALGVWLLRNLHVTGTATGVREPALRSLFENVVLSVGIAQAQLLPEGGELGPGAKLALLAALGMVAAWVWRRAAGAIALAAVRARAVLIPCAAFAVAFVAFTLATSSLTSYDPINFRLMAPVFPAAWSIVALLANGALQPAPGTEPPRAPARGVRSAVLLLTLAALLQPARQFTHDFSRWRREGRGLSQATWSESELLAFLRGWDGLDGTRPVFSNTRAAVAWYVGARVRNAPARMQCSGRGGDALRRCFLESVDPAFLDSYLVDFAAHRYPYLYTPEELAAFVNLETLVTRSDGSVYRVSRKPADAAGAGPPEAAAGESPPAPGAGPGIPAR